MSLPADLDEFLLPRSSVLLHIGPPKTGTTALQAAFNLSREELAVHGVEYLPREQRQALSAARVVLGMGGRRGTHGPAAEHWPRLVRAVRHSRAERIVVSSEIFAHATDDTVRLIVDSLGGDKVHVVITLRPLRKILPSAWQQYVQGGLTTRYFDWLERIFGRSQKPYTPTFWLRHRHGELVQRWVDVVGPDRVTVIMLDDQDRGMLTRAFEALLGLPEGLLVIHSDRANRSLTLPEVEMLRRTNIEFRQRSWEHLIIPLLTGSGAASQLKTGFSPSADTPKIRTPLWALEEAAACGAQAAKEIHASGARVIGDLELLSSPPVPSEIADDKPEPLGMVDPRAAAQVIVGLVLASNLDKPTTLPEELLLASSTYRDLVAALRRRVVTKLRRMAKTGGKAKGGKAKIDKSKQGSLTG